VPLGPGYDVPPYRKPCSTEQAVSCEKRVYDINTTVYSHEGKIFPQARAGVPNLFSDPSAVRQVRLYSSFL